MNEIQIKQIVNQINFQISVIEAKNNLELLKQNQSKLTNPNK